MINPRQVDSVTLANQLRANSATTPPSNLYYLPWNNSGGIDVETFRTEFLKPIFAAIDRRGLSEQIDGIIYSSGFPVVIDFTGDLPAEVRGKKCCASPGLSHRNDVSFEGRERQIRSRVSFLDVESL